MSGTGTIDTDKNLTFRIRGLNNIHVLDCFVNVDLEPADGVVDFGKINSRTIKNTSVSETFREGANKQVISSQADSLIKISRIWADFFPVNTSNQPI